MSPVQAIKTFTRAFGSPRRQPPHRPVVLTRAETAPCTCPEHCERDHELD